MQVVTFQCLFTDLTSYMICYHLMYSAHCIMSLIDIRLFKSRDLEFNILASITFFFRFVTWITPNHIEDVIRCPNFIFYWSSVRISWFPEYLFENASFYVTACSNIYLKWIKQLSYTYPFYGVCLSLFCIHVQDNLIFLFYWAIIAPEYHLFSSILQHSSKFRAELAFDDSTLTCEISSMPGLWPFKLNLPRCLSLINSTFNLDKITNFMVTTGSSIFFSGEHCVTIAISTFWKQ